MSVSFVQIYVDLNVDLKVEIEHIIAGLPAF